MNGPPPLRRVAVIGSGVSGLTAAHVLAKSSDVTLFEAEPRLGGHAHTHHLGPEHGSISVDTGFIVHNTRTYPVLLRLFAELGVATRDTEMSMSIYDEASGLSYAGGRGAAGFLGRPSQLVRPRFLRMLTQVRRFHRLALAHLDATDDLDETTYGDFLATHRFSEDFVRLYAVPVVACVWSTGNGLALDYPARYLFRFLHHHGMLEVGNSPQWRTVVGGSATYVEKVAAGLPHVHRGTPVAAVIRAADQVEVRDARGHAAYFDGVVVATHPDQALELLADATALEQEVLGAFRYSVNETVLHTDPSLMPPTSAMRSSWNYRTPAGEADEAPVVTYWMNRLQGLDERHPLYVTLNATAALRPDSVIATMTYRHPIYELAATRAQRRLPELNTERIAFAGAYHGWGFHEDGARAGLAAAASLGAEW